MSSLSSSALTVAGVTQLQNALVGVITTLGLTGPLFAPGVQVQDADSFDFIIVGAGTAGSVLGSRLAEVDECRVLVIEAGGDTPMESIVAGEFPLLPRTKYDWNYTAEYDEAFSQGHRDSILQLTTGRMLGGSSSLNHLIYGRGFPYDYDRWAEVVEDEGWNYENIYQYLLKLEKLQDPAILDSPDRVNHGLNGNIGTKREPHDLIIQRYLNAIEEIGHDVILDTVPGLSDAEQKLAFSQLLFFIANSKRQSTAQGYLSVLDSKSNFNILKETFVTNVVFNDDKVAIAVNVINNGKKMTLYANKEVILSAGVFNSPKVLLLSGIGPQEDLAKLKIPVLSNLPVGENFQDHVGVFLVQTMENQIAATRVPPPTQFPVPGMVGYVPFNRTQTYPDYEALNFVFETELVFSLICSIIFNYSDSICDSIIDQTTGHELYLSFPSLLHPQSRGKVQLRSDDPFDDPIINAGYLSVEDDVDTMIQIIEDTLKVQDTIIFKTLGAKLVNVALPACSSFEFQSRDYWKCYIQYMTASHFYYTSTCSLGSVVDAQLNVYGVSNLRVVDASVIPFAHSANPEIAVIVVAEKAADLIKDKYYPAPESQDIGGVPNFLNF